MRLTKKHRHLLLIVVIVVVIGIGYYFWKQRENFEDNKEENKENKEDHKVDFDEVFDRSSTMYHLRKNMRTCYENHPDLSTKEKCENLKGCFEEYKYPEDLYIPFFAELFKAGKCK